MTPTPSLSQVVDVIHNWLTAVLQALSGLLAG